MNNKKIEKAKNFANAVSNVAEIGTLYTYIRLSVLTYLKTKKDATPEELAKLLVLNTKVGASQLGIAVISKIIAIILEKKLENELEDEEDIDESEAEIQDSKEDTESNKEEKTDED